MLQSYFQINTLQFINYKMSYLYALFQCASQHLPMILVSIAHLAVYARVDNIVMQVRRAVLFVSMASCIGLLS